MRRGLTTGAALGALWLCSCAPLTQNGHTYTLSQKGSPNYAPVTLATPQSTQLYRGYGYADEGNLARMRVLPNDNRVPSQTTEGDNSIANGTTISTHTRPRSGGNQATVSAVSSAPISSVVAVQVQPVR